MLQLFSAQHLHFAPPPRLLMTMLTLTTKFSVLLLLQDNANALKAQLDQQKKIVDNLVSNTRVCSPS